jgi:hypothetical protein
MSSHLQIVSYICLKDDWSAYFNQIIYMATRSYPEMNVLLSSKVFADYKFYLLKDDRSAFLTKQSTRPLDHILSSKVIQHVILIQAISKPQDKPKGNFEYYLPHMSTYNYQQDIQEPETYTNTVRNPQK